MFPEVRAEMARHKLTLGMIASDPRIDLTISTLSKKLNGKFPLTFNEAVAIKEVLHSDLPLEKLFQPEGEICV